MCVDHLSRYVVLALVKDKTAGAVAYALITSLCPYSTPPVLLSDKGTEFRNALMEEICKQFNIKQTFTVTYYPASNGLVERANRKILDALRPVVGGLLETWEDWVPRVAASINGSVCESTGQSPFYLVYGMERRLPYDLLEGPHKPVHNIEDYAKSQLKVFFDIHKNVKTRLLASKAAVDSQQHRRSSPVIIKVGDSFMVRVPEKSSKLSSKFVGPRLVVKQIQGNKSQLLDPWLNTLEIIHSDRLKMTSAKPDLALVEKVNLCDATRLETDSSKLHSYNLRSCK